jgi:hypothetical protein
MVPGMARGVLSARYRFVSVYVRVGLPDTLGSQGPAHNPRHEHPPPMPCRPAGWRAARPGPACTRPDAKPASGHGRSTKPGPTPSPPARRAGAAALAGRRPFRRTLAGGDLLARTGRHARRRNGVGRGLGRRRALPLCILQHPGSDLAAVRSVTNTFTDQRTLRSLAGPQQTAGAPARCGLCAGRDRAAPRSRTRTVGPCAADAGGHGGPFVWCTYDDGHGGAALPGIRRDCRAATRRVHRVLAHGTGDGRCASRLRAAEPPAAVDHRHAR